MKVLGIDPGLNGAIASWDGEELTMFKIPSVKAAGRGREVVWADLVLLFELLILDIDHVFIEKVGSMPGQGVSSMFKFGYVAGGLRGIVAERRLSLTMVTPRMWKKAVGVPSDKKITVARACELFPDHAQSFRGPRGGYIDGLAEAALIAYYGYQKLTVGVDK